MKNHLIGATAAVLLFNSLSADQSVLGEVTISVLPGLGGSTRQAMAMNQGGQITGFSYLPGDWTIDAFLYEGTSVTDLGTLGGSSSFGNAINGSGTVAGEASTEWDWEMHAFVYANGAMSDLGTLGGSYSSARFINDSGVVAGRSSTTGDWSQHAFVFLDGAMVDLDSLGGGASDVAALNSLGSVTGDSVTATSESHAFLWKSGVLADLGTLGGGYSSPAALNNRDMVAGESANKNGQTHAFLWANGTMSDLGTLGGSFSSASALNSAGQVVGISTTTGDMEAHAFIYTAGMTTDLGTLGGSFSTPSAINNLGQVVGDSLTAENQRHAFLWQDGTMVDLNSLLPPDSGWELWGTKLINDNGRIVGYGLYGNSVEQFVMDLGTKQENRAPIAVAGSDQLVECQNAVNLDGTQSSDPDGDALAYEWSVGSTVLGTTPTLSVSLPLGANVVTLKVTDPSGASATAKVLVTVSDVTAPQLTGPSAITLDLDANCQATVPNVLPQVTVSDNCAEASRLVVTQSPAAGTIVSKGDYVVTVTATDPSGNSKSLSVSLTVADVTPPVIASVVATPSLLTPPNHQIVPVTVTVAATDNCSAALLSKIVSITPNEPVGAGDIDISGDLTANLAASKNPSGDTRMYTILVQCSDDGGNAAFASVTVLVPKSSGNGNGPLNKPVKAK